MVFKPIKRKVEETVDEEPVKAPVVEETPSEESTETESNIVQVPVFVTSADINRMIYENNVMLKRLLEIVSEEEKEN